MKLSSVAQMLWIALGLFLASEGLRAQEQEPTPPRAGSSGLRTELSKLEKKVAALERQLASIRKELQDLRRGRSALPAGN